MILQDKKFLRKLGKNARDYARDFDWSKVIVDLERVYWDLVG